MNKLESLAAMLAPGGKKRISEMCEISAFLVSRWVHAGKIPPKYNMRMKRGLADYAAVHGHGDSWLTTAASYLEPDECPMCGQTLEGHK